jgi:hypothetical protein
MMSPFGNEVISGYQLITNIGDIYCFGTTEFYGTIASHFEDFNTGIVASTLTPNGLYVVAADGNCFIMGPVCEHRKIEIGDDEISDCAYFSNQFIVLTKSGKIYSENGLIAKQLKFEISNNINETHTFVSFTIDSIGGNILAVTNKGRVFSTDEKLLLGDFKSLNVKDVIAVSIASHPNRKGYWLLDSIGGVFCFGAVDYFGSVPGDGFRCDATLIKPSITGSGYYIVDKNGMVLPYGDSVFIGAPRNQDVTGKIVSFAVWTVPANKNKDFSLFDKLIQNDVNQLLGKETEFIPEPTIRID